MTHSPGGTVIWWSRFREMRLWDNDLLSQTLLLFASGVFPPLSTVSPVSISVPCLRFHVRKTSPYSPIEEPKGPSTKYTACWSVGMYWLNAGHRREAAAGLDLIKELVCWQMMLIGCRSAEGPPAGPNPGIKAAIWTQFLSWWLEIRATANPRSPLQLCSPIRVKESSKDTLYLSNLMSLDS